MSLNVLRGGYLSFSFVPSSQDSDQPLKLEFICSSNTCPDVVLDSPLIGPNRLSGETFRKLHLHLGHCGPGAIQRICDLNNAKCDVEDLKRWITLGGCERVAEFLIVRWWGNIYRMNLEK